MWLNQRNHTKSWDLFNRMSHTMSQCDSIKGCHTQHHDVTQSKDVTNNVIMMWLNQRMSQTMSWCDSIKGRHKQHHHDVTKSKDITHNVMMWLNQRMSHTTSNAHNWQQWHSCQLCIPYIWSFLLHWQCVILVRMKLDISGWWDDFPRL